MSNAVIDSASGRDRPSRASESARARHCRHCGGWSPGLRPCRRNRALAPRSPPDGRRRVPGCRARARPPVPARSRRRAATRCRARSRARGREWSTRPAVRTRATASSSDSSSARRSGVAAAPERTGTIPSAERASARRSSAPGFRRAAVRSSMRRGRCTPKFSAGCNDMTRRSNLIQSVEDGRATNPRRGVAAPCRPTTGAAGPSADGRSAAIRSRSSRAAPGTTPGCRAARPGPSRSW